MATGRRARLSAFGLFTFLAMLATGGIALASSQVKGASYTGTYAGGATTNAISFKVSRNGKRVIGLSVQTPLECGGGCGGVESPSGGTAKISSKGTFKVRMKFFAPGSTTNVVGTDTVKGTFLKHGRAKGMVASHFTAAGSADKTVHWTARD